MLNSKYKLRDEFSISHYICPANISFTDFLDIIQEFGFQGVGLTERVFQENSLSFIKKELKTRALFISSINSAGYFYNSNCANYSNQLKQNKYLLACAIELDNAPLNVIVGGQNIGGGVLTLDEARSYAFDRLWEFSFEAKSFGVPLLLEPIHPMWTWSKSCVCSLKETMDFIEKISSKGANIKLNLDLFHTHWDTDFSKVLETNHDQIGLMQICDVHQVGRENMISRVPLKSGYLALENIFSTIKTRKNQFPIELEYFSHQLNGIDTFDFINQNVFYLNEFC
jgi:sugar phosphate isomerase/epimerase